MVDGEQLSCRESRELFGAFVGHEKVAEVFGVRVDEVEPDVVGAEGEVVVGAVGVVGGVDEAVCGG